MGFMIETDEPTNAAIYTATAVLVLAWVCKDLFLNIITAPKRGKELGRRGWLKMRGMQDYIGRHRLGLVA